MGNGYQTPNIGQFGTLFGTLDVMQRQARETARPTGTQVAEAVKQLRQLINGLLEQSEINVSGSGTFGGDIHLAGDLYSPHGRVTPVVTSYVAAYLQGPDGRLGATPSARRFKRDVRAKEYTLEQIMRLNVVSYRLRALVGKLGCDAPTEVGMIAEQLIHIGFAEYVAFTSDGRAFSIHYERLSVLALKGVQLLFSRVLAIEARLDKAGL